jgi:osmotically inducible protein OsmC
MSIIRSAEAKWSGSITEARGALSESGAFEGPLFVQRAFGVDTTMTNPEELIAAAHAGVFTMAFSGFLAVPDFEATSIETKAVVHVERKRAGFSIPRIDLITEAVVPNITNDELPNGSDDAKEKCPSRVSLPVRDHARRYAKRLTWGVFRRPRLLGEQRPSGEYIWVGAFPACSLNSRPSGSVNVSRSRIRREIALNLSASSLRSSVDQQENAVSYKVAGTHR